eukprot:c7336_g1_i4.p1 GENE.c7336_g1_i4~~c7336_g1_i4.p1  ORF type:complete len:143 (-),score=19.25 c7336_g1_i4:109-537(-)
MTFESFVGPSLRDAQGHLVNTTTALKNIRYLILYFGAGWHPTCRGFTPRLAGWREMLQENDREAEIVYISLDHDKAGFDSAVSTMPWLSVPYSSDHSSQASVVGRLCNLFHVRDFPVVVVVEDTGRTITTNGYGSFLVSVCV